MKLMVIGNGFDLYHGLDTGYSSFRRYLNVELANKLERIYTPSLWCEFEETLGSVTFANEFIYENYGFVESVPLKGEPYYQIEPPKEHLIHDLRSELNYAFVQWVSNIDISCDQKIRKEIMNQGDRYLNFNYTMTLEKIYGIKNKRINHIHGKITKNRKNKIIYGHARRYTGFALEDSYISPSNWEWFKEEVSAEEVDRDRVLAQYYKSTYKDVEQIIENNNDFFDSICDVSEIYVLGHSLSNIDLPYFRIVAERTHRHKRPKWKVSYHNDSETPQLIQRLESIGIKEDSVYLFKLKEMPND